jgi:predicted transcriptional regulator
MSKEVASARAPIRAETFMTADVFSVQPSMTIRAAIKLLLTNRISGAPVVDQNSVAMSVISEGDLLKLAARFGLETPIAKCLEHLVKTDKLVTVARTAPFSEIYKLFLARSIHRILVIDQRGKLLGLISRSNVLKLLVEHQEHATESVAEVVATSDPSVIATRIAVGVD